MIAVVLCDWNGTLVDDAGRAWAATAATLRRHLADGPVPTPEAIAAAWCLPLARFLGRLGVGDVDLVRAERTWNREMAARPVAARPDTVPTLRRLRRRQVEIGVITAASAGLLRHDLAATGLRGSFDHVVAGVVDKAASIRTFVTDAGEDRVLYVGDTEEDILASRRAGATSVALLGGYTPAGRLWEARPDAVLGRLGDLPATVDRLLAGPRQQLRATAIGPTE